MPFPSALGTSCLREHKEHCDGMPYPDSEFFFITSADFQK